MEQKIQKKFFVFQIIAFELGVANSHNLEQDTCHRQSICKQKHPRFHLTLAETYSKLTSLRMIKELIKALSWRFSKQLGSFPMLNMKAFSETALFREWSNQDNHSP